MHYSNLLIFPFIGLAMAIPDPFKREALASIDKNFRGTTKILARNEVFKRQVTDHSVCSPTYSAPGDGGNCPPNEWCSCAVYTPSFYGGGGYWYYLCNDQQSSSDCD